MKYAPVTASMMTTVMIAPSSDWTLIVEEAADRLSPKSDVVIMFTMKPMMPMMMKSMNSAMKRDGPSASAMPPGPAIVPRSVRLFVQDGAPAGWPPPTGGGPGG